MVTHTHSQHSPSFAKGSATRERLICVGLREVMVAQIDGAVAVEAVGVDQPWSACRLALAGLRACGVWSVT